MAGSIPGSDYYLVGGITELNFNIRSAGANADGGATTATGAAGTAGVNMYVMNVGLDLRLVDTNTLEVVDVISYQKQIIGRQVQAGVFDFLGSTFFDASAGESALEPIQLAVRSVIERAVLETIARLYHTPSSACTAGLGTASDPLAGPGDRAAELARVNSNSPAATETVQEIHNDTTHQDPYHWYSSDDPATESGLRGRVD
jgi:curli production assembly/transport component CsgG/holdfast attachment protein HfaB